MQQQDIFIGEASKTALPMYLSFKKLVRNFHIKITLDPIYLSPFLPKFPLKFQSKNKFSSSV